MNKINIRFNVVKPLSLGLILVGFILIPRNIFAYDCGCCSGLFGITEIAFWCTTSNGVQCCQYPYQTPISVYFVTGDCQEPGQIIDSDVFYMTPASLSCCTVII